MGFIHVIMRIISFFVFLCSVLTLSAQTVQTSYKSSQILQSSAISISLGGFDSSSHLNIKPVHSKHGSLIDKRKEKVDKARQSQVNDRGEVSYKRKKSFNPDTEASFAANFTSGTPADNNIAISNDGIILSAVNSNVRMYAEDGELLAFKTLAAIARDIGNFSSAYDPHTVYDPESDRFILIFLSGYSSNNTNLIIGFSQTKDPTGDWNFYKLPGNVHGDKTWSDYPFIGITHDEVFIPVLLWQNGESGWDSEAQEIIWQIDKKKGYDGEELDYKYYDKIKIANRLVWNTRPVWGSEKLYGPNMYFVGNRAIDTENDSIFLFEITNTLASGKAELKVKVAIADEPYGIPPSAFQPRAGDSLRTNYADIHGAFYHYGGIHFVGNSISKKTGRAGIYYGVMSDLESETPRVDAQIFSVDSLDLNYPNIAYAGGGGIDRSCMIGLLHSSKTTNPGSSALFVDRDGNFSDLIRVKEGLGYINVMSRDQERWGDYTGIQRKYNESGVCWMLGSFGNVNHGMDSWIAQLKNTDPQLGVSNIESNGLELSLYPNPAVQIAHLSISIEESGLYQFEIYSANGQLVKTLSREQLSPGDYTMNFNVSTLPAGKYILKASNDEGAVSVDFLRF